MAVDLVDTNNEPVQVYEGLPVWLSDQTDDARRRRRREGISENTRRSMETAARIFSSWCEKRDLIWLPAAPEAVALFLEEYASGGAKLATVKSRLAGINAVHRARDLPVPGNSQIVREAVKALTRTLGAYQVQAAPLNGSAIAVVLSHIDAEARQIERSTASGERKFKTAQRDAALTALAYDTFARRSEITGFNVPDVQIDEDGSGTAFITRSKTDQNSEGAHAYISNDTMKRLRSWIDCAELADGPLFTSIGPNASGRRLKAEDVARILKRRALAAGLKNANGITGHSARVGASQDAVAAGIDILAIQQAGRWKSARMPARYGERLSVKRGAASELAVLQGRS